MTYVPNFGVLLFGGRDAGKELNDTWQFNGQKWTQLHLKVAPPARQGAYLVYDPVDNYSVLFGGSNRTAYLNDTWMFQNSSWHQLHPTDSPPGMRAYAMTWDAADGYVLLFGGHGGSEIFKQADYTFNNQTWSFLEGAWTEIPTAVAPPVRSEPSLGEIPNGPVVLFGGWNIDSPHYYKALNDTWTYSAGVWTQLNLTTAPSPRDGATMTYDPVLQALVIFGGHNGNINYNQTWEFSPGENWTLLATVGSPPAMNAQAMVFFPTVGGDILFGGVVTKMPLRQTWLLV